MRKIWVIVGMIALLGVFKGCGCINEYEVVRYKAPNWTSDGKIVFVKDYNFVRDQKTITGTLGNIEGSWEALILCEIDNDGSNYTEIETLAVGRDYAYSLGITNTSSAGNWVVVGMRTADSGNDEIFVIKRDGSGLQKVGTGTYPDFSPDASKIVYEKPNQGIWIMNRDGSNDHCIVSDSSAKYPAWSPDDTLIAYLYWGTYGGYSYATLIVTISGDALESYPDAYFYDWMGKGTNKIYAAFYYTGGATWVTINVYTDEIDSTNVIHAHKSSWDGEYIIGKDGEGYYVCKKDGTNKWYLKDKIGGE